MLRPILQATDVDFTQAMDNMFRSLDAITIMEHYHQSLKRDRHRELDIVAEKLCESAATPLSAAKSMVGLWSELGCQEAHQLLW